MWGLWLNHPEDKNQEQPALPLVGCVVAWAFPHHLWQVGPGPKLQKWENWLCPSPAAPLGRVDSAAYLGCRVELTLVVGVVGEPGKGVKAEELALFSQHCGEEWMES